MADITNFGAFFVEDAPEIQEVLKGEKTPETTLDFARDTAIPKMERVESADEQAVKKTWKDLRSFFQTGKNNRPISGLIPILFAPFQETDVAGTDYPLWLSDEEIHSEIKCKPLLPLLQACIAEFAGESEARILRDNVARIMKIVEAELSKDNQAVNFYSCMLSALDQLVESLHIPGDEGKEFIKHVNQLRETIPAGGLLIPYSSNASFQIFGALLHHDVVKRKNQLAKKIAKLKSSLQGILAVEDEKGPQDPEKLSSALSFASSLIDFEQVSKVLPKSGAEVMSADKKNRLVALLDKLDRANQLLRVDAHVFLGKDQVMPDSPDWKKLLGNVNITKFKKGSGCDSVMAAFEKEMKEWAIVFGAMQLAELEIKGAYREEVHREFYNNFNWRNFLEEEIISCPPFILIADESAIVSELGSFSVMLSKGMPVKSLIIRSKYEVDFRNNGKATHDDFSHRQELGAIAVSHRNTYVCQSSAVRPEELYKELGRGMAAPLPGVFYLLSFTSFNTSKSFLWTSAAVSGREFPGFTYEGGLNRKWESRFSIDNNPQPQNEWPEYDTPIKDANNKPDSLKTRFTFADFAAMDSRYSAFFTEIEQPYWTEDLVELTDYLHLERNEAIGKVPFIWMVNNQLTIKKVAVGWPIILMCKERQEFWHFLQSSSGVNNFHVEQALKEATNRLNEEAMKKVESLKEEHKQELKAAVEEATSKAMENLSAVLLDMDTHVLLSGMGKSPTPVVKTSTPLPANTEAVTTKVAEAKEDHKDSSMVLEAYIDTPLCTSCNECTNINNQLFKYNENKMAYVADVNAGTFAELVEAAELCPVGIIHPGEPINKNEPGLGDLVKRAEKFN